MHTFVKTCRVIWQHRPGSRLTYIGTYTQHFGSTVCWQRAQEVEHAHCWMTALGITAHLLDKKHTSSPFWFQSWFLYPISSIHQAWLHHPTSPQHHGGPHCSSQIPQCSQLHYQYPALCWYQQPLPGSTSTHICLDSGASFCLIDATYADTHLPDLIWHTSPNLMTSTGVSGPMAPISKYTIISMTFLSSIKDKKHETLEVCLFRGASSSSKILIATEFLWMNGIIMDFKRSVMVFPSTRSAVRFLTRRTPRHALLSKFLFRHLNSCWSL